MSDKMSDEVLIEASDKMSDKNESYLKKTAN